MKELLRQWISHAARGLALAIAAGYAVLTGAVVVRDSLAADAGGGLALGRLWWVLGAVMVLMLWVTLQQAREALPARATPRGAFVLTEALHGALLPVAMFTGLWLWSGRPALSAVALASYAAVSGALGLLYAAMGLCMHPGPRVDHLQQDGACT